MTSQPKTIFVVSGPAGSGKTTVATCISKELAIPYLEGDDYHTEANKAKMASGTPLNDGDRWDWLITLRNVATENLRDHNAIVLTCSSLRRRYRDVFRVVSYTYPAVQVHFVYLKVDEEHLKARVTVRVGHYMKQSMVRSQMECLEEPSSDEFDVEKIDVHRDQTTVCEDVVARVRAKLDQFEPRHLSLSTNIIT